MFQPRVGHQRYLLQHSPRLLTLAALTPLLAASVLSSSLGGCSHQVPSPAVAAAVAPAFVRGPMQRSRAGARYDQRGARLAPVQDLRLLPTPRPSSLADSLLDDDRPLPDNGLCPPDMASIDDRFCIDRYEASLVEILPNGEERPWSPFESLDSAGGHPVVRAMSAGGVVPQAYINEVQAKAACARSGKRLCEPTEWRKACMGPSKTTYPYGRTDEPGVCNDHGRAPMLALFHLGGGSNPKLWPKHMNDPRLDQLPGTVALTGSHSGCTNGYGVYDMVGNVHEWVDDPKGTFQGGFYLDTHELGDGCKYRTPGHDIYYHDYSTGFRCCADVAP